MSTVFAGLSRSRLALSQLATSVTQWHSLETAAEASSTGALTYTADSRQRIDTVVIYLLYFS